MFWRRYIALEKGFRFICILSWLEIALANIDGRQSYKTNFRSTSTHCEIHLTLRQRIFLVCFGIVA